MYRKIVSELAYSPALAGNLGLYIKQFRDETSKRQIGLIFITLAIMVQLFATLFPPESANANNPAVFIDGGITSVDEYLGYYDQNTGNVRDLLTSLGIQRTELEAMKRAKTPTGTYRYVWSAQNTRENESIVHFFTTSNSTPGIAYFQPASPETVSPFSYVGTSSQMGEFAIVEGSASLITEKAPDSPCDTWLSSSNLPLRVDSWFDNYSRECQSIVATSLSGHEIASSSKELGTLGTSSRIIYTVSLKNNSENTISTIPSVNLEDALEYSRILDYGGGIYDFDTRNLTWPVAVLEPGTEIKRTFIIQLLPTIPATSNGEHVKRSYDCEITLSFGNRLSSPVDCPLTKYVEKVTEELPSSSPLVNIIASATLVVISAFLYARSKQLLAELYIIRHNHLGGL